jgi:hypothetical protein
MVVFDDKLKRRHELLQLHDPILELTDFILCRYQLELELAHLLIVLQLHLRDSFVEQCDLYRFCNTQRNRSVSLSSKVLMCEIRFVPADEVAFDTLSVLVVDVGGGGVAGA